MHLGGHHLGHEKHIVQKGSIVAAGLAIVNPSHHPSINRFVLGTAVANKAAGQFETFMCCGLQSRGAR